MHKKSVRIAVAALALTALLSSCGRGKLPKYDYEIDMKDYKSAVTVTDKAYLILVNKQNPCGEDYAPENISAVPSELTLYGKEVKLEANAALAAEALILELHARGYTDIVATSGSMTGGSRRRDTGSLLSNERKIQECKDNIAKKQKYIEKLKAAIAESVRLKEEAEAVAKAGEGFVGPCIIARKTKLPTMLGTPGSLGGVWARI